jgi:DNA-binding PadR family transcriptional regulator
MKEVVTMANKKTVVQMYEELLAIQGLTQEQKDFLTKRIEITKNKNAKRSTEPTPKQLEKMAETKALQDKVVAVMTADTKHSPTELVKLVNDPAIPNTQKLTPLLTALVADGVLVKDSEKGRSVYSLSADTADEE